MKKVAELAQPVICDSADKRKVEFMPTIAQIDWNVAPSLDKNEYWFPYWQRIQGKEKYGQFAPMIGSNALLQLLKEAIRQDFFTHQFLADLAKAIKEKLETQRGDSGV